MSFAPTLLVRGWSRPSSASACRRDDVIEGNAGPSGFSASLEGFEIAPSLLSDVSKRARLSWCFPCPHRGVARVDNIAFVKEGRI
jgi:hypothetical protein